MAEEHDNDEENDNEDGYEEVTYGPDPTVAKYLFTFLGIGAGALAIGLSLNAYFSTKEDIARMELERAKVERGYVLQERDLNGNNIPDKFYTIDGKIAVVELDGKPLVPSLETRVLEKE